jgi:uncharacterized protein YqgV (UPF0045/DUF77 family)
MKKKLLVSVISTSVIASILSVSSAPSSNAVACTAKEIASMQKVDFQMAMTSLSGDLTDLFAAITKASNSTKNKSLKTFYAKLEAAVEEDNGVLQVGESRKMWRTLQTKYQYKRC